MKEFKFIISKKPYNNKDEAKGNSSYELIRFRKWKSSKIVTGTVKDLVDYYVSGHTVCPAYVPFGKQHIDDNVIEKHVAIVDIDNDAGEILTIKEAISLAEENGLHITAIYTSFSHTEEHPKFRIVFALDQAITDKATNEELHEALFSLFTKNNTHCADLSCSDFVRLFFGGKELICSDYTTMNTHDVILRTKKDTTGYTTKSMYEKMLRGEKVAPKTKKSSKKKPAVKEKAVKVKHPVIDMINKQDRMALRGMFKDMGVDVPLLQEDLFTWASHFDLSTLLGLPVGEFFRCIHTDHNDSDPSAMIYEDGGKQVYKCFGCMEKEHHENLIDIVMRETGLGLGATMFFIGDMFGVAIETDWQQEKKQAISYSRRYLQSEEFKTSYPDIYKRFTRNGSNQLRIAIQMLHLLEDNLSTEPLTIHGEPVLYKSNPQIAIYANVGLDSVKTHRKDFVHLEWMHDAKDEEITNKNVLNKSNALRKQKEQETGGKARRVSFTVIPELSHSVLKRMREIIKMDAELGATKGTNSYEQTKRAYGEEKASRDFAQDGGSTSNKHDEFFARFSAHIMTDIAVKNYCVENDAVEAMSQWYGKKTRERLAKECRGQLIAEYGLKRDRANDDNRTRLNITEDGVKGQVRIFFRA